MISMDPGNSDVVCSRVGGDRQPAKLAGQSRQVAGLQTRMDAESALARPAKLSRFLAGLHAQSGDNPTEYRWILKLGNSPSHVAFRDS